MEFPSISTCKQIDNQIKNIAGKRKQLPYKRSQKVASLFNALTPLLPYSWFLVKLLQDFIQNTA